MLDPAKVSLIRAFRRSKLTGTGAGERNDPKEVLVGRGDPGTGGGGALETGTDGGGARDGGWLLIESVRETRSIDSRCRSSESLMFISIDGLEAGGGGLPDMPKLRMISIGGKEIVKTY